MRALDLCQACESELLKPWNHCHHCGLPTAVKTAYCGHCLQTPHAFDRCIPLAPYAHPIDHLITEFKHQGRMANGKVLGELLAHHIRHSYVDAPLPPLILPVPLHWRRQWRRGFNQAWYLSQVISRVLEIPVTGNLLQRVKATPSQQQLDRRQRQGNLRHTFRLRREPACEHVALVDDVVTTGSTTDAVSAMLKASGVVTVDIWCLARTPETSARRGI